MLRIDALETTRGSFRFGPVTATVEDEVLAILGPSGCGKTTLLSLVAGIVRPDRGSVFLDGKRLDGIAPERRGTVLVFQEGALFPHMTARENVEYAASPTADVEGLVSTLEIDGVLDQRASTLSGGERQRVALARALAADPDALLLDEPLTNLDAPIRRLLRDDLRGILAPLDIPVVYVTHDRAEATTIGDRIGVLRDGRLQQIGTPSDVFERPATPFVASFTGSTNLFRGTVGRDSTPGPRSGPERQYVQWGPYQLETSTDGVEPGTDVWFAVRPEYVEVAREENAASEDPTRTNGDGPGMSIDATDASANVIAGRVTNRVFEGVTHRVTVHPDGVDADLELTVLPPAFERHQLADRERVPVVVPPDAIHLDSESDGRTGATADELSSADESTR